MTISHHPSDATLAAFASGALDEGRRLVVAVHLAGCAACRAAARSFETLGGSLLADEEPLPMNDDALERALGRIAIEAAAGGPQSAEAASASDPLSAYALGYWRWIGPGVHWRSVDMPAGQGTRVFMLKAAPGTKLPHHRHSGFEWTCILQGAFRHEYGRYGAGDFDEADEADEHHPAVDDGEECICLVAMQGHIQLQSWVGRLLQPLIRI